MSDKCTHNNHSHFMLWFFIYCMWMSSCLDCSGQETRTKNAVSSLEWKVSKLEAEVGTLNQVKSDLSAQKQQNTNLQIQINELRGSVFWLQDNTVQKKKP